MIPPNVFFKAFGLTTLFISLIAGFVYWTVVTIKKFFPDFKYIIKYKVLRKKFDIDIVSGLYTDISNGVMDTEIIKGSIMKNMSNPEKVKEIIYIYKEMKRKMKGGITK